MSQESFKWWYDLICISKSNHSCFCIANREYDKGIEWVQMEAGKTGTGMVQEEIVMVCSRVVAMEIVWKIKIKTNRKPLEHMEANLNKI
jgi:hypothetical protein